MLGNWFDAFFFVVICWILIAVLIVVKAAKQSGVSRSAHAHRQVYSDGHIVPRSEDLTCDTGSGHCHAHQEAQMEQEFGKRYIVHSEPETGYVILNGVKRALKDCGKY